MARHPHQKVIICSQKDPCPFGIDMDQDPIDSVDYIFTPEITYSSIKNILEPFVQSGNVELMLVGTSKDTLDMTISIDADFAFSDNEQSVLNFIHSIYED
jgi:hypothetical protein